MDFREDFRNAGYDSRLAWYNEPGEYSVADGCLVVRPDADTDFWQKTCYGFTPDSGHLLYLELVGDFDLETHVHFSFANQYDQAGLLVRTDAEHWVKTSVEYEPAGPASLGVVMTDIYSNWSISGFYGDHIYLRVRRVGDVFGVYHALDGQSWNLMRLGWLALSDPLQAGLYACAPKGAGMEARFDYLQISPPQSKEFH